MLTRPDFDLVNEFWLWKGMKNCLRIHLMWKTGTKQRIATTEEFWKWGRTETWEEKGQCGNWLVSLDLHLVLALP